jgi:hypothetical protein
MNLLPRPAMPSLLAVLPLLLIGCPTPEPVVAGPTPAVSTPAIDDPSELITDVQHLLGETAALHAAERYVEADRTWQSAYNLFQKHLAPTLRLQDPTGTLAIEYAFGQLRSEVQHRSGRPKPLARSLEVHLEDHRAALVTALTPAAEAQTP